MKSVFFIEIKAKRLQDKIIISLADFNIGAYPTGNGILSEPVGWFGEQTIRLICRLHGFYLIKHREVKTREVKYR